MSPRACSRPRAASSRWPLRRFSPRAGQLAIALPLGLCRPGPARVAPDREYASFGQRTQKTPGQVSRVRSAFVEMELDHDTGALRGRILAGRHEGAALDALDVLTLVGLLAEIDPKESRALLATYLDRREPGWREHVQGDAAAGQGVPPSGPMTEQEAYQILGLEPGASARRDRARAPHAHEETPSRPGGVDVSRGPRQRGQGHSSAPPSLMYSTRNMSHQRLPSVRPSCLGP